MIDEIFNENGILAELVDGYEQREAQAEMSGCIFESLYNGKRCIIEAGTGVGKTVAYLIPALYYAVTENKKVAVTTETKALQQQIMLHEIPVACRIVKKLTGEDPRYSLCLGSSNYPCRKRLEMVQTHGEVSGAQLKQVAHIGRLMDGRGVVTRFDIRAGEEFWQKICRDPESCGMSRCRYASRCVFLRAKKEWQESHLLVMNHYLFFTNVASGKTYLPDMDAVFFDEAHSLERIASTQLGFRLSAKSLRETLDRLIRKRKGGAVVENVLPPDAAVKVHQITGDILKEADIFFAALQRVFPHASSIHRVKKTLPEGKPLVDALKKSLEFMEAHVNEECEEMELSEFDMLRGRLFTFMDNLDLFITMGNENFVYWVERQRDVLIGDLDLVGQPVEINDIFSRDVARYYESLCFVSATLAINDDFSYIASRLGLHDYKSMICQSPFQYKRQSILFLNRNGPSPVQDNYAEMAARDAASIISMSGGRTLMLFTSYSMLRSVKNFLEDHLSNGMYCQGEMSATEALSAYRDDVSGILLGTHSFWQGIDLPGDMVRCVIIMRLPFGAPDNPPVQARIERIKEAGGNAFGQYQLPEAVLLLKQGFGRLIRSSRDRGVVAILDSRICGKTYGNVFLKSLPDSRRVYSIEDLEKEILIINT
ncbi:MAG: ATP-dependent DNA helicase [Spirochaetota bacterium]